MVWNLKQQQQEETTLFSLNKFQYQDIKKTLPNSVHSPFIDAAHVSSCNCPDNRIVSWQAALYKQGRLSYCYYRVWKEQNLCRVGNKMVPRHLMFYWFQSNSTARKALVSAMSIHVPVWLTMCDKVRNAFYCSHIHIKHLLLNQAGCLGCFFLIKNTFSHCPFPTANHTVNALNFKTKIASFTLNPSSSFEGLIQNTLYICFSQFRYNAKFLFIMRSTVSHCDAALTI